MTFRVVFCGLAHLHIWEYKSSQQTTRTTCTITTFTERSLHTRQMHTTSHLRTALCYGSPRVTREDTKTKRFPACHMLSGKQSQNLSPGMLSQNQMCACERNGRIEGEEGDRDVQRLQAHFEFYRHDSLEAEMKWLRKHPVWVQCARHAEISSTTM